MRVDVQVETWIEEPGPLEQHYPQVMRCWSYAITVAGRTYRAERNDYAGDELVTFTCFSHPVKGPKDGREPFDDDDPDGDRREPFRGGQIPYDDPLFVTAARAALRIDGVRRLAVDISTETGVPVPVDPARLGAGR